MIKKRIFIATLFISAAALVAGSLVCNNTIYANKITAQGDSHTLIFNRDTMTVAANKQSATCVASTKSGGTITASMGTKLNEHSHFCEGTDTYDMYNGMYYSDDESFADGYWFEFKVTLRNVGKVTIDDIVVNVGLPSRYYDIRPYVSIIESEPFIGMYQQQIAFTYSNTKGTTSSFYLNNIHITYPCK